MQIEEHLLERLVQRVAAGRALRHVGMQLALAIVRLDTQLTQETAALSDSLRVFSAGTVILEDRLAPFEMTDRTSRHDLGESPHGITNATFPRRSVLLTTRIALSLVEIERLDIGNQRRFEFRDIVDRRRATVSLGADGIENPAGFCSSIAITHFTGNIPLDIVIWWRESPINARKRPRRTRVSFALEATQTPI